MFVTNITCGILCVATCCASWRIYGDFDEVEMGRIELSRHFSMDVLCDKVEVHAPFCTITIGDKPPWAPCGECDKPSASTKRVDARLQRYPTEKVVHLVKTPLYLERCNNEVRTKRVSVLIGVIS